MNLKSLAFVLTIGLLLLLSTSVGVAQDSPGSSIEITGEVESYRGYVNQCGRTHRRYHRN